MAVQKLAKGKKGRKLRGKNTGVAEEATSLVFRGAAETQSSADMYFTGQSLQEHCEHNPCYLCNEFDEPHAARHHNIKKWPPELTTRYNINRENWMVVNVPPKFTQKFTLGSQIHETVKFERNSYELRTNLPQFPLFRFLKALKAFICLFL